MDDRWMRALLRPLDLLAFLSMTPVPSVRAPRIQGASRRRGVPFPEGRRTGTGPSAGRVRRRPAPGDNGPPARELAEGPRPGAAGERRKMKDMTVETLNFIILCMGLLFVMAGILLIVGKLAGKRPSSIAGDVLMIAWGLLCVIPELRSWMLARATDLEHTLEAMWAGLDGDGRMLVYIFALWLMGAIVIMVGGRR